MIPLPGKATGLLLDETSVIVLLNFKLFQPRSSSLPLSIWWKKSWHEMYTETGTEQDRSRMVENTLPFHSANENFGNSTQKFWWNGTCPVASYFHSNKVLHKLLPYSPTKENHGQPKGGVREMLIWNPDLTLFYAEMAVGDLGSRLGNCIMCVIPFPSPPQNKLFVPEWVPDLGQTIQIM